MVEKMNDAAPLATAALEEYLGDGNVRVGEIWRAVLTHASRDTPAGQIGEGDALKLAGEMCWSEMPRANWFEMVLQRRMGGWEVRDIAVRLRGGGRLRKEGEGD